MLRITIVDTPAEQRLVLEGKLTEPSIAELELAWEKARNERRGRECVVDLNEITTIDQCGKAILTRMFNEGAQFIAQGVATAHLIRAIQRHSAQHAANRQPE